LIYVENLHNVPVADVFVFRGSHDCISRWRWIWVGIFDMIKLGGLYRLKFRPFDTTLYVAVRHDNVRWIFFTTLGTFSSFRKKEEVDCLKEV